MAEPLRIEDYALIGNCSSAALVGCNGSIDWLCFPRFDSPACFAALLGDEHNGCWRIAPGDTVTSVTRSYRPRTLILETTFETPTGSCVLIDSMSQNADVSYLFRHVRALTGSVDLCTSIRIRFEYGSIVPWVTRMDDGRIRAIAGPDQLVLATTLPPDSLRGEDMATVANFTLAAGDEVTFSLSWNRSHLPPPAPPDVPRAIRKLNRNWRGWSRGHIPKGPHHEAVLRSLITLKALTDHRTSGIVAASTTSLPERIGGNRNWDYRYCWLRDAAFTLYALLDSGFTEEARGWRDWLLRAVAGSPARMQTMYGVAGERRLDEFEIPWLPGYRQSAPVRIGNAASQQLQLDVFGEVVGSLFHARKSGLAPAGGDWNIEHVLIDHLACIWDQPDAGIWEVRGPDRHFTYSKAMAWLAVDCGIRTVELLGYAGDTADIAEWRTLRDTIHVDVCRQGFDPELNSFVQSYGSKSLDASLLLLAGVGFLPPTDPRIVGTVAAVEKYLLKDGLVARYITTDAADGVGGGEGAFLACSFWLVDNWIMQGRLDEAEALFTRLLSIRNDVGLFAEEYDPIGRCQVGNFPQAFSHVALINSAHKLAAARAASEPHARS